MDTQTILKDARVVQVRTLKREIERLRADNQQLRVAQEALSSHLDLALLAVDDLRTLEADGCLVVVDGWNLILGAQKTASSRADLVAQAQAYLAKWPHDGVWLVFDGPRAASRREGRLRISYTGGEGVHRADRLICDYLRMARWRGDLAHVRVLTNDRDFAKEVRRLGVEVRATWEHLDR